MAEVITVNGGQWGDEGKGKVVDRMAQDATMVIRAQGGDNAGHTVVNEYGKFGLNLIPAGIFNPNTLCIIGAGVVANVTGLIDEIKELNNRGIQTSNLRVHPRAHLVFEYNQLVDGYEEDSKGQESIGTTKRGIGPTYEDKVGRVGIRAEDLACPEEALGKIAKVLKRKQREYPELASTPQFDPDYYRFTLMQAHDKLAPLVQDTTDLVYRHVTSEPGRVIIEGAQGTLLSIDEGTYPMVTSSNTTVNGLLMGAGIGARFLTRSIGIFKAYQTRVGGGPMPTELKNGQGDAIRENGKEYGVVSGRPRRIGYFDAVLARYAQQVNGFTDVVITRLDTLSGMGDLAICRTYFLNDRKTNQLPSRLQDFARCQAVYKGEDHFRELEGGLSGIERMQDLPKNTARYIQGIKESIPDVNLLALGNGERRESLIFL